MNFLFWLTWHCGSGSDFLVGRKRIQWAVFLGAVKHLSRTYPCLCSSVISCQSPQGYMDWISKKSGGIAAIVPTLLAFKQWTPQWDGGLGASKHPSALHLPTVLLSWGSRWRYWKETLREAIRILTSRELGEHLQDTSSWLCLCVKSSCFLTKNFLSFLQSWKESFVILFFWSWKPPAYNSFLTYCFFK